MDPEEYFPHETKVELLKTFKEGLHIAELLDGWIDMGLDINAPFLGHRSLLQEALEENTPGNALPLALELIRRGVDVEWYHEDGVISALNLALTYKPFSEKSFAEGYYHPDKEKVVLALLDRPLHLHFEGLKPFDQPLLRAFIHYPAMIPTLLEKGASPNFVLQIPHEEHASHFLWVWLISGSLLGGGYHCYTPSEQTALKIGLKALFEHGLSPDSQKEDGESLSAWLLREAPLDIQKFLLDYEKEHLSKMLPTTQSSKLKKTL